jgi:hypothetical protein
VFFPKVMGIFYNFPIYCDYAGIVRYCRVGVGLKQRFFSTSPVSQILLDFHEILFPPLGVPSATLVFALI